MSLFSGIGGLDLGLERAGHRVIEMCESWEAARAVLDDKFPRVHVDADVRQYEPQLDFDLLTAGFPCVDLSHAGRQTGIFGPNSGLVEHVFRIAEATRPEWLLLENVPNLLRLQSGAGIRYVVNELERLGYDWSYRVLDSRAFGVPQRRNRVLILARLGGSSADYLLGEDTAPLLATGHGSPVGSDGAASGFYWTEGRRGVGLVDDAIPTLKGGSTVGAPSAPGIWVPGAPIGRRIVTPAIEDAEALQGFERGWTSSADRVGTMGSRWKLVGNSVTVQLAEWLGERLAYAEVPPLLQTVRAFDDRRPWPDAAFGGYRAVSAVSASRFPRNETTPALKDVVQTATAAALSYRATRGFLSRIEESGLPLPNQFMSDLESHLTAMRKATESTGRVAVSTSWATSPAVRKRMQATKASNTAPEIRLRQELTKLGLRYQLQRRPDPTLRWRSDVVFKGPKVAVEVRGCFWHVCPQHQTWPQATSERWERKLLANQERDRRMEHELRERGWLVVVVWEHEDPSVAAARVLKAVDGRRRSTQAAPRRAIG